MKRLGLGLSVLLLVLVFDAGSGFAQGTATGADTLVVKSLVLTTNVVNRNPVDSVRTFSPADSEAFCHIRVQNSGAPTTVTFRWLQNNQEYFTFDAHVGVSGNWRTYTSITPQPGDWTVQILDEAGNVLKQQSFTVGAASN